MSCRHIIDTPTGWAVTRASYKTKEAAKEWTNFVKKAWHGLPVKVIELTQSNIDKYDLNREAK